MAEKLKTQFHDCEDQEEVDAFLEKVEAGDALEFRRTGFYHHWGLCIGRNESNEVEVVHVTAPEDTSKLMAAMAASGSAAMESADYLENIGKPFKESLHCVMPKQNFVRVNNSIDAEVRPFAVDAILKRVKKTLRDGGWGCYHFVLNNCEHYVNYCRNGNHVSLQSLKKGRLALGYLATEAKKLADFPPTPGIGCFATFAGFIFTVAEGYVAKRERRFRGQVEVQNSDGENSIEDLAKVTKDEYRKSYVNL